MENGNSGSFHIEKTQELPPNTEPDHAEVRIEVSARLQDESGNITEATSLACDVALPSKLPGENTDVPTEVVEDHVSAKVVITLEVGAPASLNDLVPRTNSTPLTSTTNPTTPELAPRTEQEVGEPNSILDGILKLNCELEDASLSMFDGPTHAAFIDELLKRCENGSPTEEKKKQQRDPPLPDDAEREEHDRFVADMMQHFKRDSLENTVAENIPADDTPYPLDNVTSSASLFNPEVIQRIGELIEGLPNAEMEAENQLHQMSHEIARVAIDGAHSRTGIHNQPGTSSTPNIFANVETLIGSTPHGSTQTSPKSNVTPAEAPMAPISPVAPGTSARSPRVYTYDASAHTTTAAPLACPLDGSCEHVRNVSLLASMVLSSGMIDSYMEVGAIPDGITASTASGFISIVHAVAEGRLQMDLNVAQQVLRTLDETGRRMFGMNWKDHIRCPAINLRSCRDT